MDGLPTKTGDVCTILDGRAVYVRVLNELQRDEAREEADFFAASQVRGYRKGGAKFETIRAELDAMSADEQSAYLAETAYLLGEIREQVEEKHPFPERPERGDLTEEKFMEALETWEAETTKVTQKRNAAAEKLFEDEKKKAANLTAKVRTERCFEAVRRREWRKRMVARHSLEILLRAARKPDAVNEKYFSHIQEVIDLGDADRETLIEFYYREVDSVSPAQIPTSPEG